MSWYMSVTPPAAEPISLDDAKAWLRIATTSEDDLVADLIRAARSAFETETGIVLVTRRLRRHWRAWPAALKQGRLALMPGPASALIDVAIRDASGAVLTPLTEHFILRGGGLESLARAPRPHIPDGATFSITFDAGFGAPEDVPGRFQQALRDMIGLTYARGEDASLVARIAASFREVQL